MLRKIKRLFTIKTRLEAYLVIYALALGATERGSAYLERFPGYGGYLLFLACTATVFMAGAHILDSLRGERERERAAEQVESKAAAAEKSDVMEGEGFCC